MPRGKPNTAVKPEAPAQVENQEVKVIETPEEVAVEPYPEQVQAAKRSQEIEGEIQRLLDKADPLRELEDDDPKKAALPGLVDDINALRAEQSALNNPVTIYG